MVNPNVGLTSEEARQRLLRFGPNEVEERRVPTWRRFLGKFWGAVPWMLEATLILELVLGKLPEAVIILFLLVFNALLSFRQERQAEEALAMLRQKLHVDARVLRDGVWQVVPARELVPGDYIHLRMGDFAPADTVLDDGEILVDQSTLTGEAVPVERRPGEHVYSGSIVRRGEASGVVEATGAQSYFGRTTRLVAEANAPSHLQELVLGIVRGLVLLDGVLVLLVFAYGLHVGLALSVLLPFALILLVASVPVALPATFTLSTAIASQGLAKAGVLVTRLSAIEEVAAMDVLCTDKTGTLTKNELTLSELIPAEGVDDGELLLAAAIASDTATQDPLDLAVLRAAGERGLRVPARTSFSPFDPATKRSEATYRHGERTVRVIKGAPQVVAELAGEDWEAAAEAAGRDGARVLAVAAGGQEGLRVKGLIAFSDPLREDAPALVQALNRLGIGVRMLTGDAVPTASAVAARLGLVGEVCKRDRIEAAEAECAVYAGVLPEDKFRIVKDLEGKGHVVGMTGDGVNDAPALREAEVGVAVASATDVAKAAAGIVLTSSGLAGVVAAVRTGRMVYQRMLTYTLNKIVKTIQVAFFLSLGLVLLGRLVVTPLLVLLLLFANDFVTMSLSGDQVRPSATPDRWDLYALASRAGVFAGAWLVYVFAVALAAAAVFHGSVPTVQTIDFVALVYSGLANVFVVRERSWLWSSRPGTFLLLAATGDVLLVAALAVFGLLMVPVPLWAVAALFVGTGAYMVAVDAVKALLAHPRMPSTHGRPSRVART